MQHFAAPRRPTRASVAARPAARAHL